MPKGLYTRCFTLLGQAAKRHLTRTLSGGLKMPLCVRLVSKRSPPRACKPSLTSAGESPTADPQFWAHPLTKSLRDFSSVGDESDEWMVSSQGIMSRGRPAFQSHLSPHEMPKQAGNLKHGRPGTEWKDSHIITCHDMGKLMTAAGRGLPGPTEAVPSANLRDSDGAKRQAGWF